MGIAKALTNDLERALRLYRIPILTALAFSMRRMVETRFLMTDDQSEDTRRNVIRLRRVSTVEQNTCKPGLGVDDRQFTPLTGNLMFTGLPDANGVIQPIYNLTNMGGRTDLDGVVFTATGTPEEKTAKARRYNNQRPGDVTWRVRTPVMMADETTAIDYIAFRCTQLKYLHSISFKWSDRRWDTRVVGLDQDLYRPEGEKTQMITLAPMWMDESMSILNPAIWGPFEALIQANYEEALGRKIDEQVADCAAFVATYRDYINILTPSPDAEPAVVNDSVYGRVTNFLETTANRSLHIPFDQAIVNRNGNDSYRVVAVDPNTALDVTQDVFNLLDAQNHWRLTSSFEGDNLADDGWCGEFTTCAYSTDIPADLPPFATDRAGNPVLGTKSVQVGLGHICHRMVLPNGSYALRLWLKNVTGNARIEVIRNNRLRPKGWAMSQTPPRVTSIKHWRENYETVAATTVLEADGWREFFVSFDLIDSLQVPGEGYPAHEVYIVLTAEGVSNFDHLELFQDKFGHEVAILNTVNLSSQPYDVRPELRHVNLEKAFQADSPFGTREVAASSFRLDGRETVVQVINRPAYNIRPEGTTLDTWFKVNSDDEQANSVLTNRGSFTLFQKTGAYLPGYSAIVDRERYMIGSIGNSQAFSSRSFRNTFLHPSVGNSTFPPRTDWGSPDIYDTFKTAYKETGLQPMEWTDTGGMAVVGASTDIGGGKFLLVDGGDPYLPAHGSPSSVPISDYLLWHARRAYAQIMPIDQVNPSGTQGGFVFAPVPINAPLYAIGSFYGNYTTSPAGFSPRFLYSPLGSPWPSPLNPHGGNSKVFSPGDQPSPNQTDLHTLYWPIDPANWGDVPVQWPADAFLYGGSPAFDPFAWSSMFDDTAMNARLPMFVGGKMRFDRWIHFNMAVAIHDLEVSLHGLTVYKLDSYSLPGNTDQNGDDLLIGTNTVKALRVAAPVSFYSFKVFQYFMPASDRLSIFSGEATNFNELQYNVYGSNLDYSRNGRLNQTSDLGLYTVWPDVAKNPYQPFPTNIEDGQGQVVASIADPFEIPTDLDRNRNLLADWYDNSYLQELIDIQTIGFSDGLILWDFMNEAQAATYDYIDRVWDPNCKRYVPRTLSYLDWLHNVLAGEWNSVTAVQDPMPGFAQAGSPSPWPSPAASPNPEGPWPTYGDRPSELIMTGVKGWFGWKDLLGYRDSLAQVAKEGIVFNYLQVEYHFRAPRTELEALLRPYAHSIDQLFFDDFVGNHLTKQTPS
jgi:hypothetical protein